MMAVPAEASQVVLSKESSGKLKCGSCQGLLSVSPITMEGEGKFVCGRCNSSGTRVTIYEELAKYMTFPCKYSKCKEQIAWDQVDNHERNCPHQTLVCPFNSCKGNYALKGILQHFKATHEEYVYNNETQIIRRMKDMPSKNFNPERKLFLFLYNTLPYIVIVCLDQSPGEEMQPIKGYQFSFGIYSVSVSSQKIMYNVDLQISTNGGVSNYELKNKEIKPFDQRLHCLKCYNGSCNLPCHSNKKKSWLSKIKIDNQGDMNATYKITIHEDDISQAVSNISLAPNVDSVSKITCFCRELMTAPIYVCVSGHSLCMKCKRNMENCPVCKQTISDIRNLALEQIAETIITPCENVAKGCKYSGSVKRTKQHSIDCKYNFI